MSKTGNKTAEHVRTCREIANKAKEQIRFGIHQHEGKKYLRKILPADGKDFPPYIMVDVYSVLVAFNVTCPATAHAIKKLLCGGQRSKGDLKADLIGALAAINRAIDLSEE